MSRSYLQHGRRHGPNGSDPIPGLGGDAAAYLFASFNSGYDSGHNQSIAASHVETDVKWYSMERSDGTVFATNTAATGGPSNAAGDTFIQLLKAGIYLALATLSWESGSFTRYCYLTPTFGIGVADFCHADAANITQFGQATTSTSVAGSGPYPLHTQANDMFIIPSDYVPGAIKLVAGNMDSVAHNAIGGTIGIYYFGGSGFGTESSYTVY